MSTLTTHELAPGVKQWRITLPNGWSHSTTLVPLREGVLVYNPARLGADLATLGDVRMLVHPNHFHHLAFGQYRAAFPGARVVASARATRRLERQGHSGLLEPHTVASLLPEGTAFHVPDGTRNGELWVSVKTSTGTLLLVGDAVFHLAPPLRGPMGLLFRALAVGPGLSVGRTFRWVGARGGTYLDSLARLLHTLAPTLVVPAHGAPLDADGARRWLDASRARLS